MTAPDLLTRSQIAQRLDELEGLKENFTMEKLDKRLAELTSHLEHRNRSKFNRGVVTPVPPDAIDYDNGAVITPKSPEQIEVEYNEWNKSLEHHG